MLRQQKRRLTAAYLLTSKNLVYPTHYATRPILITTKVTGFGDPEWEYWLGLERIHCLAAAVFRAELKVDMMDS